MRLEFKQLKQLNVETQSGQQLGKVYDLVLELDEQFVAQYKVHSMLRTKEYLISRDQVVRFEKRRMIVTDGVMPIKTDEQEKSSIRASAEPVVMRE